MRCWRMPIFLGRQVGGQNVFPQSPSNFRSCEGIVPIPGTKRRKNLEENVAALGITLTREDLQRIDEAAPKGAASGERYEDMSVVNR